MAEHGSAPGRATEGTQNNFATANDTPSGYEATNDTRPRCLRCGHPLTLPRSVSRSYGPHCWTRVAAAQRHERAAALHGRLWSLLRRLPDLEVDALTRLADALDDIDTIGGAR